MFNFHFQNLQIGNSILLREFELVLPPHGFILITGENGCGKTTFLKRLANHFHKFYRKNSKISFVSALQHYETSIPLLGKDFYALYSKQSWPPVVFEKFGKLLHQRIDRMSSGELQALILISNILSSTHILILDEPLSHLSQEWAQYFSNWLQTEKTNKLIISVSHQTDQFVEIMDQHYHVANQSFTLQNKLISESL